MVGVLIRMKVALLRSTTVGARGVWVFTGVTVGGLLAVGTIVLSVWPSSDAALVPDLLAALYLTWAIGWVVGPLRASAPLLRAEHFAMLPLPPRRLAFGLLVAAFVGAGAPVTLLALVSLATYAARLGPLEVLVAIPAIVLQLGVFVVLSRVAAAMFAKVARVRVGAALNGALLAIVMVLSQSGWMLVVGLVVSDVLTDGFPAHWSSVLRASPSGWGLTAVEAADDGAWWLVVAAFAGMGLLIALSIVAWARLLDDPRGALPVIRGPGRRRHPPGRAGVFAASPTGAVFTKELRTWWRDPARTSAVVASTTWGVATAVLPLTFGEPSALPWAAPLIAVMAATYLGNAYASDGTGVWLTLQTASERSDVRGRQWAFLAVFAPITVVVAVGFTWWSGLTWAWPWVIGLLASTLGGGAGLVAWCSVHMPSPGLDPRQRVDNPLETADDDVGAGFVVFFAALLPPVPAAAVLALGEWRDAPWLTSVGVVVGVVTGALVAWGLGRAAGRHLVATGPELLSLLRTGRTVTAPVASTTSDADDLNAPDGPNAPDVNVALQTAAWTLGSLALFPQGLVPIVLKLSGQHDVRVWFLAMYVPEPFGWIAAVGMAALGLSLYTMAIAEIRRASAS